MYYIHDFVWKKELSGKQKLVMLAIAHRSDYTTGECWPSVKHIAKLCTCTPRYVQKIIAELVELGHLERVIGGGLETPNGATNLYIMCGYAEYYAKVKDVRDGVDPKPKHRGEPMDTPPLNRDSPPPLNNSSPKQSLKNLSSRVDGAPTEQKPLPQPSDNLDEQYLNPDGTFNKATQAVIDLVMQRNNLTIAGKYLYDDINEYGLDVVKSVVLEGYKHNTNHYTEMRWRFKMHTARKSEQYRALIELFGVDESTETDYRLKQFTSAAEELQSVKCSADEVRGLYAYVKRQAEEGHWRQWGTSAMLKRVTEYRNSVASKPRIQPTQTMRPADPTPSAEPEPVDSDQLLAAFEEGLS